MFDRKIKMRKIDLAVIIVIQLKNQILLKQHARKYRIALVKFGGVANLSISQIRIDLIANLQV
jgi:hypothetical protein